jgi:hypothetical protein
MINMRDKNIPIFMICDNNSMDVKLMNKVPALWKSFIE